MSAKPSKKRQPPPLKSRKFVSKPPFPLAPPGTSDPTSFDNVFDNVVNLLRGKRNVVVLAGAGLSVSCGIPDFRSTGSGLYDTLDTEGLGLTCAEDIFDLNFFSEDPGPFYKFARKLYFPLGRQKRVEPSDSHRLLALLDQKKMLLRVYTQNIDGLESVAGVSKNKIVYAHGSLQWATCCKCRRKVESEYIMPAIEKGQVARCDAVKRKPIPRPNSASSQCTGSTTVHIPRETSRRQVKKEPEEIIEGCGGVMKPGITFFGESLNDSVRRSLESDRPKVDALVVIGTSLSVAPISKVIQYLPPTIPRILVNRAIVRPLHTPGDENDSDDEGGPDFREGYTFDAYLLGYCDDVTRAISKLLFAELLAKENSKPPVKKRRKSLTKKRGAKNSSLPGGKILSELGKGETKWDNVDVPRERVLLFPGALEPESGARLVYQEVAHCDGCSCQIQGTVFKCSSCFDYDLCRKCFPKASRTHFGGKHSFVEETMS